MIQRFTQSSSATSSSGSLVSYPDYERLAALLAEALDTAQEYFVKVGSGEMTAAEANTVLRVTVRIS